VTNANYLIQPNRADGLRWECTINQQAHTNWEDHWVHLGTYFLNPGARVQLDNMSGGGGTVDVGYDAIAFVPRSTGGHACGDPY
jgi:hypothetical protein